MRIDSVIFDFDGTVVDSEPNYYEADRLLMAEYGIDFTFEMKKDIKGWHEDVKYYNDESA